MLWSETVTALSREKFLGCEDLTFQFTPSGSKTDMFSIFSPIIDHTDLELMLHNIYANEAKKNILSHCQSQMSR